MDGNSSILQHENIKSFPVIYNISNVKIPLEDSTFTQNIDNGNNNQKLKDDSVYLQVIEDNSDHQQQQQDSTYIQVIDDSSTNSQQLEENTVTFQITDGSRGIQLFGNRGHQCHQTTDDLLLTENHEGHFQSACYHLDRLRSF